MINQLDYYRSAFLSSLQGRKVLEDMIARSKLFSGKITEKDIDNCNFVISVLHKCGLFRGSESGNGFIYHESLEKLIEKLPEIIYEGKEDNE